MADEPTHDFPRNIGRPATGALLHAGYTSMASIVGVSRAHLASLHGVGPVALDRLQAALEAGGRSLGD